jgi:hypothetical protein
MPNAAANARSGGKADIDQRVLGEGTFTANSTIKAPLSSRQTLHATQPVRRSGNDLSVRAGHRSGRAWNAIPGLINRAGAPPDWLFERTGKAAKSLEQRSINNFAPESARIEPTTQDYRESFNSCKSACATKWALGATLTINGLECQTQS